MNYKLDYPDWILAQLFHSSKLDLPRFKLICESVRDTIVAGGHFNQDLLDKLKLDEEVFDIDDARACFGAVNYIITNACQLELPSERVIIELEQLGLPSEHCQLLCNVMSEM